MLLEEQTYDIEVFRVSFFMLIWFSASNAIKNSLNAILTKPKRQEMLNIYF